MSDKGRWFRVYARQVREHPKFRDLTGVELGAWTALRAEAELRDRAVFADRDEAVLVLKRRKIPRPGAVLDRLISLKLFDVDPESTLSVHDRADHDRPQYPSDQPEKVAERQRKSRARHESVTSRDTTDGDSGHDTHARVQPQQASPAPANSVQPQPQQAGVGLPADGDSATVACRLFVNGGRWLGDREYVQAWDDMDRRFGEAWVQAEIQPAYQRLHSENPKVKPWALKHAVELACAERVRESEIEQERAQAEAASAERRRQEEKAAAATDEDKRRAAITRRAIGLWIKRRPSEPVPTDFDELESWLRDNEPQNELRVVK